VRHLLADDLARVLREEPLGVSGRHLARQVRRRLADVLATLHDDPRFEQHGRNRGSRWRLAAQRGPGTDGKRCSGDAVPWVELDPSGVPLAGSEA
jgi:hypothetical protein